MADLEQTRNDIMHTSTCKGSGANTMVLLDNFTHLQTMWGSRRMSHRLHSFTMASTDSNVAGQLQGFFIFFFPYTIRPWLLNQNAHGATSDAQTRWQHAAKILLDVNVPSPVQVRKKRWSSTSAPRNTLESKVPYKFHIHNSCNAAPKENMKSRELLSNIFAQIQRCAKCANAHMPNVTGWDTQYNSND